MEHTTQARSPEQGFRFTAGCLTAVIALGIIARDASAEDRLALGGAEYSAGGSYVYAGAILPITHDMSGSRFVQKYWLDWLTYSYDKNGQTIDAQARGLEAAVGYQMTGSYGWSGLYAGALLRNTQLSPDDIENGARGTKLRLKLQADGELTPAHWRLGGIAAYVAGQNAFWLRARTLHDVQGDLWTGPELIYQGDPTYRRIQLGWVLEGIKLGGGLALGVKAGASKNEGQSVQGYLGLEIARWF